MIRRVRLRTIALVMLLAAQASSCGYALAGRGNALPDTIRIIGVPDFQNRSQYPDIDRYMTESVREEFQARGRYQTGRSPATVLRYSSRRWPLYSSTLPQPPGPGLPLQAPSL